MKNSKYKRGVLTNMLAVITVGAGIYANTVAYYTLEDGFAGNDITATADASGNGYTAGNWSGNESAAKYSSEVGGAYVYDPVDNTYRANTLSFQSQAGAVSNDCMLIGTGAGNNSGLNSGNFTYEMFIKVTDSSGGATSIGSEVVRLFNLDGSSYLNMRSSYQQARATQSGVGLSANMQAWSGSKDLDDGLWHHLAVTLSYDEAGGTSTISMYYDYELLGSATDTAVTGPFNPYNDLRFGIADEAGGDLNWYFDEARLSDTVLSNSDFLKLTAVPEPASLALISLGGLVMLGIRKLRV